MSSEPVGKTIDIQVNGYLGVDFNDPTVAVPDICRAAAAMRENGVSRALPTVITGATENMVACITQLRTAIEHQEVAAQVFAGIHIEGPFLSPEPGFIGAHPVANASQQDLPLLEQLCTAGGQWTRLVTLAPEMDCDGVMTQWCVERGIRVAAGHTDASLSQLETCLESGLSLFTHLGNGCPRLMDRHDNIIYRALRFSDRMHFSLIADGFHIPRVLFENMLNWIPQERVIVVSDAISAAGLGPGTFQLGERSITIGEDGAARDPSGEHFVGSASTLQDADRWLANTLGLPLNLRQSLLYDNAQAWLA